MPNRIPEPEDDSLVGWYMPSGPRWLIYLRSDANGRLYETPEPERRWVTADNDDCEGDTTWAELCRENAYLGDPYRLTWTLLTPEATHV